MLAFWSLVNPGLIVAAQEATVELGIANTGELRARDIIIQKGLREDEILTLMRAWRAEESASVQMVAELAAKLAVNGAAATNFLRILDQEDVPDDQLLIKLAEIADRHNELVVRLAILDPRDDPEIAKLVREAKSAIELGEYNRGDDLLARAEETELAAARQARELERQAAGAADRRFLNAAARRAERGELSWARLNYREAAEHFAAAFELVPVEHAALRAEYMGRKAWIRYNQGLLREAIAHWRNVLILVSRDDELKKWAYIQSNVGQALMLVGELNAARSSFDAAITALRELLEDPLLAKLEGARVQHNLGWALMAFGWRGGDPARLEEAVAVLRQALEEPLLAPLERAVVQNNLGWALMMLSWSGGDPARLEEAIAVLRQALEKPLLAPLDRARARYNLGWALTESGWRSGETARLEEAIAVLREALEEPLLAREAPLERARVQHNLGWALRELGSRSGDTARLEEAIAVLRQALDEPLLAREAPLERARVQNNLGQALMDLGSRSNETVRLQEAVAVLREVLKEPLLAPLERAQVKRNLGQALMDLEARARP